MNGLLTKEVIFVATEKENLKKRMFAAGFRYSGLSLVAFSHASLLLGTMRLMVRGEEVFICVDFPHKYAKGFPTWEQAAEDALRRKENRG